MRRKSGHQLFSSKILFLAFLTTLAGCARISQPRVWGDCAIKGGVIGAFLGGGLGAGLGLGLDHNSSTTGLAAGGGGAAGGAILGALIGHYWCDELVAPPEAPPPPLPPAPPPAAPLPPPQERIVLRGVHFDFDRANIRPDAAPILDEAADILSKHPDVTVDVNGYCDAIGSYRYNLKLSRRRAASVASYLEGKGIAASRLVTHGYGKTHFVATNRTAEGRQQNRRVELVPVGGEAAPPQ